jgi:alkaline phosphatase D
MGRKEANAFSSRDFPQFTAEEAQQILDAGRRWNGGKPPDTIRFGDADVPNFRKDAPAQTILGEKQKAWFLDRLKSSRATWKIWGNTAGTLDMRADPDFGTSAIGRLSSLVDDPRWFVQATGARLLGLTPRSVYNKLRKHQLLRNAMR